MERLRDTLRLTGDYTIGGATITGSFPSMPAILYGKPKVDIQFIIAASTCHVFDYKTYKRGKIFERYPYSTKLIPFQHNVDTVTIGSIYGGSSMTVYGRALVPIVIKNRLFQVDVYLVDLHPAIQCILSMGFLAQYRADLDCSTPNRPDIIFRD